jgi:tetratricopeptide (TPR) repeat protein
MVNIRIKEEITDIKLLAGLAQWELKNASAAKKILQKIVEVCPNNYVYLHYLAILYYADKMYEESISMIKNLTILWPFKVEIWNNASHVYKKLKLHHEAQAAFLRASELMAAQGKKIGELFTKNIRKIGDLMPPEFFIADCPLMLAAEYNSHYSSNSFDFQNSFHF